MGQPEESPSSESVAGLAQETLAEQVGRNRQTRAEWETYAPHRLRVTQLLEFLAHPAGSSQAAAPLVSNHKRLAVLGAGNCNDLDLPALLAAFGEVHLLDWDDQALQAAAERQGVANHPQLHLHPGVNFLTGEPLPAGPFDVVASVCLLSQLLEPFSRQLTTIPADSQTAALEKIQAIREGHLRLLMHSVVSGGHALFVSDLVSSDTTPELLTISPLDGDSLFPILKKALDAKNFFTGLHPGIIRQTLASTLHKGGFQDSVNDIPPWIWSIGPRKMAVYGFWFGLQPAR